MANPRLSYWEKDLLSGVQDVIIVGGGIVGLSCAIAIKEESPSKSVIVLEKFSLSRAASTRNAGFACFGSPSELVDDLENFGEETVSEILSLRYRGIQNLLQRVGAQAMDYQRIGGYEVFFDRNQYEDYLEKMSRLNEMARASIGMEKYFSCVSAGVGLLGEHYAIRINGEGMLHPGKMMNQLAKLARDLDIGIYTGCQVQAINQETYHATILLENGFSLKARKCCLCTNGFARKFYPDLQVEPARNQVLVSEPIKGLSIHGTYHYDQGYVYFRNIGNRLLIGGMRNHDPENERTDKFGLTKSITERIKHFVKQYIHAERLNYEYAWSGILGVGNNKRPIVSKISPSIIVAVRLGGMGVAIGTSTGEAAAKLTID